MGETPRNGADAGPAAERCYTAQGCTPNKSNNYTVARPPQITALLERAQTSESALNEAVSALYSDLRQRAGVYLRRHRRPGAADATLQPTALVNETYLRLLKQRTRYVDRGHFLAIATRVMLRVLADYQRAQRAQKRGGDAIKVTLNDMAHEGDDAYAAAADLAAALDRLEALDERKANVFRLRGIWCLQMNEVAEALEISLATAERDWRFAKSWIAEELEI